MAQQRRERTIPNPVALPGTASVHEAACMRRDAESGDVMVNRKYAGRRHWHRPPYRQALCGGGAGPGHDSTGRPLQSSLRNRHPHDRIEQAVPLLRSTAMRRVPVVAGG